MAMAKNKGKKTKFTTTSTLPCPKCRQDIGVGTSGLYNLQTHQQSKDCKPPKGMFRKITDMFDRKPQAPLVPATVSDAPVVNVTSTSSIPEGGSAFESIAMDITDNIASGEHGEGPTSPGPWPHDFCNDNQLLAFVSTYPPTPFFAESRTSFPESGNDALGHLRAKIDQIPLQIILASHRMSEFFANPADFFGPDEPEDRDYQLNTLLERVFKSDSWTYDARNIHQYLDRDGVGAFCTFFKYFVRGRGFSVKNILDIILMLEEGIDQE
ncbi:hypothetical protein DFH07DRAFT_964168 [Mycena maculata]|uniref:Uncharacterized protein n=1 Tax=Mycena maculata TaxID=230809 RepID=A0AAD7IHG7_9AGAR|nr:hypothetical protein DFH07DRAFT_964168 [Mycena maculata]